MPRYGVIECFPLQILSFHEFEKIIATAIEAFPQEQLSQKARSEWKKLAEQVSEALADAFLFGPSSEEQWLPKLDERWANIEEKNKREVRIAYLDLLDQIYGAIFRHTLRHAPTAVCSGSGHFCLQWISLSRHTRLENPAQPLKSLMQFIYEGGPRLKMEFSWAALGEEPWEKQDLDRNR